MKREDDQQLWDLLGRVERAQVSPFFARNVVRKIRERADRVQRLRVWLTPGRLAPAAAFAMAIVAALLVFHHPAPQRPTESAPDVIAKIDPQDYDVVADLDELLATDESSLWDDDTQTL
jgi:uncharacterized NAD(P)/FAD-binding protein YdhS